MPCISVTDISSFVSCHPKLDNNSEDIFLPFGVAKVNAFPFSYLNEMTFATGIAPEELERLYKEIQSFLLQHHNII